MLKHKFKFQLKKMTLPPYDDGKKKIKKINLLFLFDCPEAGEDWVPGVLGLSSSSFTSCFISGFFSSCCIGSDLHSSARGSTLIWKTDGKFNNTYIFYI